MVELRQLVAFCDQTLAAADFDDYCPNGIQVEAGRQVRKLVSGVTASLALIDVAAETGADALLVHHGYFWRGEPAPLTGAKGERVRRLMVRGISLVAYHLPLDAHNELGNNACLGRELGLTDTQPVDGHRGLLWIGDAPTGGDPDAFARHVGEALGRPPTHVTVPGRSIRRVAWCTGAAQAMIEDAAQLGVDAFLTGEASERTTHQARELGLHFLACGHHATERYGVQALGAALADRFGIEHRFVDLDNPF